MCVRKIAERGIDIIKYNQIATYSPTEWRAIRFLIHSFMTLLHILYVVCGEMYNFAPAN